MAELLPSIRSLFRLSLTTGYAAKYSSQGLCVRDRLPLPDFPTSSSFQAVRMWLTARRLMPPPLNPMTCPASDTALTGKMPSTFSLVDIRKFFLMVSSIFSSMCVDSCPGDYFVTPEMRCQKCHGSCSSCSGSGLENCLSCNPTFAKMIDSDLCVEKCPERYHFGK